MTKHKPKHIQATVYTSTGFSFEVDKALRKLIQLLWDNNIHTRFSCEDNRGETYIMFDSLLNMEELFGTAFSKYSYTPVSNYSRSLYEFLNYYTFKVTACGLVCTTDGDVQKMEGKADVTATLRFPKCDLILFEKLLFKTFTEGV